MQQSEMFEQLADRMTLEYIRDLVTIHPWNSVTQSEVTFALGKLDIEYDPCFCDEELRSRGLLCRYCHEQQAREENIFDSRAMDMIHAIMDRETWTGDTLEKIAEIVRLTGRTVNEPAVD